MKSVLLSPEECKTYTPALTEWVDKSMSHSSGERTVEQLLQLLYEGKAQCWCVLDDSDSIVNITTTEILDYPNKRVLHIITSTGIDWENHKQEHKQLEDFAKSIGCSSISVWGRKGWSRKLPSLGYEQTYVVFEKKL